MRTRSASEGKPFSVEWSRRTGTSTSLPTTVPRHRHPGAGGKVSGPFGRHPQAPGATRTMMTSTHSYRGYVFATRYHAEDPAYLVDFPDVPDIITSGSTLPEAYR